MRSANLAVKFLLELAAFAAFCYWGARTGTGAGAVVLAIIFAVVAILNAVLLTTFHQWEQ